MNSEKLSFEKDLWGKYNFLHERLRKKNDYIKLLKKSIEPIYDSTKESEKKFNSFKITLDPTIPSNLNIGDSDSQEAIERKLSGISLTINIYMEFCKNFIEATNQTFFLIINGLDDLLKKIKTEKDEFNTFMKCLKSLTDNKNINDKNMKLYQQKMSAAENSVYDLKKAEFRELTVNNETPEAKNLLEAKATQLTNDCIKPFKYYFDSVQKVNEIREESIEKQRLLLNKYQNIEEEFGKTNTSITRIISLTLESINKEIVEKNMEEINTILKNININKDIQQFISENKGNDKPEEEILFINFKSIINFNECENIQTYEIYRKTIEFIKEIVENEYPNYDEQFEKDKNDLREILFRFFSNYEQESAERIMGYIKNTKMHEYFLILLSKLRTNNRYEQSKEMIDFLGNILNIILNESEKSKNYPNSKNCIILSQTFFYNNNNGEKCYILDKIINHKWFTKKDFWINFAKMLIEPEIDKLLERYPEITRDDINNHSEKMDFNFKKKINEILYSQLLAVVSNMNEFKLSIEKIVEIIEVIISKYDYLSEEDKNNIFNMISDDQKKINSLRKNVKKIEPKNKIKETNDEKKPKINNNKKQVEDNLVIINLNQEKKKENKNMKEMIGLDNEDKKMLADKRKSMNIDINNKNKEKPDKEKKKSGIFQNIKNKFTKKDTEEKKEDKKEDKKEEKKEEKKETNFEHRNSFMKDLGNKMLKIDSENNKFTALKPIPKNDNNNNNKNNKINKNDNNEKQSNASGNPFGVVLKKIKTNNNN